MDGAFRLGNPPKEACTMKTAEQYKKLTIREFTKAAEIYETDYAGSSYVQIAFIITQIHRTFLTVQREY